MPDLSPAELQRLLATADEALIRERLSVQYPADVAELLASLDVEERLRLFRLLEPRTAAEVINEAGVFETTDLFAGVPTKKMAALIAKLPSTDITEIIEDLPADKAKQLLELMDTATRSQVEALRAYPEDSAGRLMHEKVVRVQLAWTVDEAIRHLRKADREAQTFAYLYAVNAQDQLIGLVRVRKLLTSQADTRLADIVEPNTKSVTVDTDQEAVAREMSKYNFSALPVVDATGRLKGVITHDDILDVLEEEATEDIQRLGGSDPLEEPYLSARPRTIASKRIGWLLLLLLAASLTSQVMGAFQDAIASTVALALFVPLIIGTGGNAGSQTTSMVIRALAVGDVERGDARRVLWRELRTGLLMGPLVALAAFGVALAQTRDVRVGGIVAGAVGAVLVWSTSVGALLPFAAARLRFDPTVVSGPVMSTLVDSTGLLIYFSIARAVLRG